MSNATTKSSINSIPVTNTLYWSVYYSNMTNRVNYYFLAIAVPIGCVLNLIAIAVFSRKRLNQSTMGFFNQCLAVSNILTLIFSFLMYSGLYFPVDLLTYSTDTCRFISFSRKQVRMISPWIQTIFTFDLYLSVSYPSKFTFLKKKRNILLVIFIMTLVLAGMNSLNALFSVTVVKTAYVSVKNESLVWSKKACKGSEDMELASNMILDFVRCFIPFAIMTILSLLIILKVRRSSRKTANANHTGQSVSSREVRQNQFAITLVLTNVLFMLFNFPVSISHIWMDVYFYHMEGDGGMTGILLTFAWSMGLVISTAHYVIFFFTNLLGNRLFRNEFKAMLANKELSQMLTKNHSLISSAVAKRLPMTIAP